MTQATQPEAGWQDFTLPTYEAQLAGTLALMTCHAQAALDGRACPAMAHKIAANLGDLSRNGALSGGFRTLMEQLARRWSCTCGQPEQGAQDPARWHPQPEQVQ